MDRAELVRALCSLRTQPGRQGGDGSCLFQTLSFAGLGGGGYRSALLGLELSGLESRKQADDSLIEKIPNWAFRQFLLTNLQQRAGVWQWRVNLCVLRASMMELSRNPLVRQDSYSGPTLFLRGGKSGYLRSEHFPLVTGFFPAAKIVTLPDAGHDLHVDDKDGFLLNLNSFLENLTGF
jgi:esterase